MADLGSHGLEKETHEAFLGQARAGGPLEGERIERIIDELSRASQGSATQRRAERELFEQIFGGVERLCRHRYLPDDESAQAALQVVERMWRNNYQNLRAFRRWRTACRLSRGCTIEGDHAGSTRTFEVWLRRLCQWEVRRRLQRYVRGPWLESVDVSLLPDHHVSFADEALVERELGDVAGMIELAYAALTGRQREALHLYALGRGQFVTPGKRHAQTRRYYELIAAALALPSAEHARGFVRAARQRLQRALRRLHGLTPPAPSVQ